jgi:hypothetical protein
VLSRYWAWALLACPLAASAADAVATLTLLEGTATLVRGVTRYALAEGVQLQAGDILEVGDKALAEIEFADGAALTLGPKTRLLARTLPRAKAAQGDFYVPQGVMKVARVAPAARLRYVSPLFAIQPEHGSAVLLVGGADESVFVEGGALRLAAARARGASAAPLQLSAGQFFSGASLQRGSVGSRLSPGFIAALPKLFLDPLPSRLARFKDRAPQPRALDTVSYAEVETWLKAPLEFRRPMLARFRSRIDDEQFRAALVANLRYHPEWDPVLFPEKYEPKEPDAPAQPPEKRP